MAIGKASDFTIYQEQFHSGMSEVIEQETGVFNAASRGAIQLRPNRLMGDYQKQTFYKTISSLVSRRDTTSVATATDLALTHGELVSVKLNRKIGPVAQTLDALRKIGKDDGEISYVLGKQMGAAVMQDYCNTAVSAVRAAIANVSALVYDGMAGTSTYASLVEGLAKFGDAQNRIVCWVMHSKSYFDLMKLGISDKVTNVADVVIYNAQIGTLGRPTIVADIPALYFDTTTDEYYILGLTEGAVIVEESEERDVRSQLVTGLENLVYRIQGEYAYNLSLKGYAWDVANGGANPAAAAVVTGSNWDKVSTDNKSTAGIMIKTQ